MDASSSIVATVTTVAAAAAAAATVLVPVAVRKIKKPQPRIIVFEGKNPGIENSGLLNDIWTLN